MSDDYYDDDEPGGLWDPDAFTPARSEPARPALHLVTTPADVDQLDRRVAASNLPDETDQHTLVRLEQFRTASERHEPRESPATRPTLRRAAAAGLVASVAATAAVAYGTLTSPDASDRSASSPRAAAVLGVDSEHAAATREVESANSRVRNSRQLKRRTTHHTQSKGPSVTATQNPSAPGAHHAPTASGSHAATSVVVRTAAPTARHQAQAASATSEFGFEG